MKRFKIESVAIVDQEPDCYRVTIYASPSGRMIGRYAARRHPIVEETVSGLTAVEALIGVITRLGLAAQITNELFREAVRKQDRATTYCQHCGDKGPFHFSDICIDGKQIREKDGTMHRSPEELVRLYTCRCGFNWTEGIS